MTITASPSFSREVSRIASSLREGLLDFALEGEVPPEPGTSRIPSGHVRLYHYTRVEGRTDRDRYRVAEKLRRRGILMSMAKGSSYSEPNQIWASTKMPSQTKVFAEFHVSIDDHRIAYKNKGLSAQAYMASGYDMTFLGDIKPRDIIAVHEPWHWRYRYIKSNPRVLKQCLAGEFDDLLTTEVYGPAIYRVKQEFQESSVSTSEPPILENLLFEEKALPHGAKLRSELAVPVPDKLWHVTLSASKILSQGFRTSGQGLSGNDMLLGGSHGDSASFTSDKHVAERYAAGLRVYLESLEPDFQVWEYANWATLLKRHGFPARYAREAWILKNVEQMQARGRYTGQKASFEIAQTIALQSRGEFPLIMGGSWPSILLRSDASDVAILEIGTQDVEWVSHHPREKEFRIYDVWNITQIKQVG